MSASPWPKYDWTRWNLPLARNTMAVVYIPQDWTPSDVADLVRYLRLFATTRMPADEAKAARDAIAAEVAALAPTAEPAP